MRFLAADIVFDGENFLSGNPVLVVYEKGLTDIITPADIDPLKVEKLKGVITPGFVNAHCHLELSHMKGKIPEMTGLPEFGMQIIRSRNSMSREEMLEAMSAADSEMWENGIVAVGDISNTVDSILTKRDSKINYHSFIEILGLHPDRALNALEIGHDVLNEFKKAGLNASLAPHAPYSTSLELISAIASENEKNGFPSTIHNEESLEELKFFKGEASGFHSLYKSLNVDLSFFTPPHTSSLRYYLDSLGKQKTLLVHNTFTSKEDIANVKKKNILWCFCPNANLFIENQLPDFSLFSQERFCLGTDSLASNHQLDLISEANIVLKNSNFTAEKILQSITSVPAKFFGFENLGKIKKGNSPGLNLIGINGREIHFYSKII